MQAAGQQLTAAHTPKPARPAAAGPRASNPQLADPTLEKRVERLLKQMTLEEKIGQLVQYNDSGPEPTPAAPAAAAKPGGLAAINP